MSMVKIWRRGGCRECGLGAFTTRLTKRQREFSGDGVDVPAVLWERYVNAHALFASLENELYAEVAKAHERAAEAEEQEAA